MEEQHYKAQERIQQLLESNGNQNYKKNEFVNVENTVKPTSLYPCDNCTKKFLTADSLRSHQQRKHSTIEEKHELSDDNEKGHNNVAYDKKINETEAPKLVSNAEKDQKEEINALELESAQTPTETLNTNNNDGKPTQNCAECSKKLKTVSSSVAVQCSEGGSVDEEKVDDSRTEKNEKEQETDEVPINESDQVQVAMEDLNKIENDLIQKAYETINELKREIVDLRNALNSKERDEIPTQMIPAANAADDNKLDETNGKIEVMAKKFNAFEAMYTESQNQFIESFRNLDERQKAYMSNIQETVKEIVEKSLGKHESNTDTMTGSTIEQIETKNDMRVDDNQIGVNNKSQEEPIQSVEQLVNGTRGKNGVKSGSEQPKRIEKPVEVKRIQQTQESDSESSSESAEKHEPVIFQAEVHTIDSSSEEEPAPIVAKNNKKETRNADKDDAVNEFEQRLRQLGVDADSVGLSTPRSQEVNQELAEEREEMKKVNSNDFIFSCFRPNFSKLFFHQAHKSFNTTRNKLKSEVDRIAKVKLRSASSVTSLSSLSHDSEEQSLEELEDERARTAKMRPKSANIKKIRKRNAKNLVKKYVDNDINESDIMNKMEMAQQAINAHRECIQELLQTTAHAPNKVTRIKYPSAGATATANGTGEQPTISNAEVNGTSNQYNKMPNVTTRRVVFVNLDEDS